VQLHRCKVKNMKKKHLKMSKREKKRGARKITAGCTKKKRGGQLREHISYAGTHAYLASLSFSIVVCFLLLKHAVRVEFTMLFFPLLISALVPVLSESHDIDSNNPLH
jgi:hypothetical protein